MDLLILAAWIALAACALWTMEENRKWKKLALKMQDMAVKEQEEREKAEMETQWWRERVEIVKAERDRLRHFETECRITGRALDERKKELARERDKCAELRRLLAETREMLDGGANSGETD